MLAISHKAVNNIRDRMKKMYGIDAPCEVFASYLPTEQVRDEKTLLNKTIFIDEFSMVSDYYMTKIYNGWQENRNEIFMFGDANQLQAVETDHLPFNITDSPAVSKMSSNFKELEYIVDSGRYTQKMFDILQGFLKTGKLSYEFKPIDENLKRNIVSTNKKRQEITRMHCKVGKEVTFIYQEKKETYKVSKGMPLLCTMKLKQYNMYNNDEYTVQKVEGEEITVNNIIFPIEQFARAFIPAYACTIHKYQGGEINKPYNIYEVNKMDKNALYTALSRTTHENFIQLDSALLKPFYQPAKVSTKCQFVEQFKGGKYSKGKIYEVSLGDFKYVGLTTQSLNTRLKQHVESKKSAVHIKMMETGTKPEIKLLKDFPCFSEKELKGCEDKCIAQYIQLYGDKCINRTDPTKKTVKKEKENVKEISIKKQLVTDKSKVIDNVNQKGFMLRYKGHKKWVYYRNKNKEQALEEINQFRDGLLAKNGW